MNKWVLISACILAVLSRGCSRAPIYVGIEECRTCHEDLVEKWEHTAHSKAYERVKIKNGTKEPHCVKCHVTGFFRGGYKMGAPNAAKFEAVQCEACHGPGSRHIKLVSGDTKKLANVKGMGLVKPTEMDCKKMCHTNAHFTVFTFEKYWPYIDHTSK